MGAGTGASAPAASTATDASADSAPGDSTGAVAVPAGGVASFAGATAVLRAAAPTAGGDVPNPHSPAERFAQMCSPISESCMVTGYLGCCLLSAYLCFS